MPTALAWQTLTHDRRRLAASVAGIGFAVLLMLVQLGFRNAIYDSTTALVDALDAELLMISRLKDDINPSKPFPRVRLEQARAADGVVAVSPLWLSRLTTWSTSGESTRDLIRVIAFEPDDPVMRLPEVRRQQHRLRMPDTALVDRKLRDVYGGLRTGTTGELEGRRIEVVGDFELGPDVQLNANLLISAETFARVAPPPPDGGHPLDQIEIGLLHLRPGADPERVATAVRARVGADVVVLTPPAFAERVHTFWGRNQPVGAVFGLGLVVGFFIGLMICYQVLFTDVVDQLPQFATMKAIGYRNHDLVMLAIHRGTLLGVLALAAGLPLGVLAYRLLDSWTRLAFTLTLGRIAVVAVAAITMCVIASLLATRKALRLDPAEVF